ncbi:kynureninase [Pontivivens insulae]|uniref:Kynureninase n=1 Tax=Pontivivens insulae TaxID=1639689 RepID=A0A2R8AFQ7_9RHOB|nr:kynureninase [Pontivivens insulae]RED12149.1 kynureninase [Pontivivens insulae]SPF30905.1 Kynureninase [Pontivivens insulae]
MTDFAATRTLFHLPEGMIYLDGNSLGPLPKAAQARLTQTLADEWGEMLITGWNKAGWMAQATALGDRIAPLIGAEPGSVTCGDTLSIKVYQALAAALDMTDRKIILSDTGNFPSDLYMAQGLIGALDQGHELVTVAPERIAETLSEDVGVLMLTEVDYRSGRKHDMAALTKAAQALGIITIWDLAHSAGALPVHLSTCNADFAVGCTYKYLNGGPGAPAFIYVAPRHVEQVRPALSGWLGHEAPFAFDADYRPGGGIERMRVGTPPILQFAALDAALDAWEGVDLHDLRAASIALSERFIAEVEARTDLVLASPRVAEQRGSQVSFAHPHGYAVMQALIARGVVGDFRAPNLIRFGFTPLYLSEEEVVRAAEILAEILESGSWDRPEFHARSAVT